MNELQNTHSKTYFHQFGAVWMEVAQHYISVLGLKIAIIKFISVLFEIPKRSD